MDRLYYDGRCPLCRREMTHLERLRDPTLELVDIHSLPGDFCGPDRATLLQILHLKTPEGHWVTGLPANVRAWSHTRYGWLWRPLLWPGLRTLAELVYHRWALRRYRRRYDCSDQCLPEQKDP